MLVWENKLLISTFEIIFNLNVLKLNELPK